MKLILTDDEGVVIEQWKIGNKPEFDLDDLDAEPECNFYTDGKYSGPDSIGRAVWNEALKAHENGLK